MILTIPGWPGTFDVDIDYRHGSPASWGPNGGDPGDPDQIEIELIVWEFDGRNNIVVAPPHVDGQLYRLLEAAAWEYVSKNHDEFQPGDDDYFYEAHP